MRNIIRAGSYLMAQSEIHPTAIIAADVQLGNGVYVGPYAVIENQVTIGDGCLIEAHAMIRSFVQMGETNHVYPQAVIGGAPQDLQFNLQTRSFIEIGNHNVFREGVTVHRSASEDGVTRIGSHNYLMTNSHIAHDCQLENNCIFATGATLGGFVEVGDRVFLGGGVMIHQFCRVGRLAMIRGLTGVSKDVLPYTMLGGFPARHYRLNLIGLRRAGVKGERLRSLSTAFRNIRQHGEIGLCEATFEISYLLSWMKQPSKRGLHAFIQPERNNDNNERE
ncbi:MAG: acyl-ACP--UDP-N-acetylglucosamine O-acyltransferase [Methylococcales bacterium]